MNKLILVSLIFVEVMAMEQPQVMVIMERTESPQLEDPNALVISQLDVIGKKIQELDKKIEAQKNDIESHKKDTKSDISKTRMALVSTAIITIGGVATAIITFLATKYVHNGSN